MWMLFLACAEHPPAESGPDPEPTCAERAPDDTLEPDADGPDTQIHVASAADGSGAWLTWNLPDANGKFDVWAAHLACDGTVDVGPVQVDDSDDNETDPAVAVLEDRVLVAWMSDNGGYPDNLDVRWRVLDTAGQPVGGVTELKGAGNAWMPAVAASAPGFVLAGARSNGTVFAGFSADLDADGVLLGDTVDYGTDPGLGEYWPSVAAGDETWLAWEGDDGAYVAAVGAAAESFGTGLAPNVSAHEDSVWVGFGDGISDLFVARPGGPVIELKGGAAVQHSVALEAGSDGGGHAVWYENVSGLANRVKVGRFDADGDLLETVDLGTDDAAPYGTSLTRIDDDTVLVAWQEGKSPAFRLRARFVTLTAAAPE